MRSRVVLDKSGTCFSISFLTEYRAILSRSAQLFDAQRVPLRAALAGRLKQRLVRRLAQTSFKDILDALGA
jgi:hypothetical protein